MNKTKLVVIGGVAAGASFAARARRLCENAEIMIIERGPDVSFANCGLPYFIGGEIAARDVLAVQTPATLQSLLNLDVRTRCEAIRIDRPNKRIEIRHLDSGSTEWQSYDTLMLAPGASPLRPPIPGIDDKRIFTLRNLEDMDRIVSATETGMRAVVIGAGFIGLEMAEQLRHKGLSVQLVELQQQVFPQLDAPMVALLESELRRNDIGVTLGDGVARFESGEDVVRCHLNSGKVLDADLVILSIGVKPDTELAAAAGLQLGPRGQDRRLAADGHAGVAIEVGERRGHLLAGHGDLLSGLLGGVDRLVIGLARGDAGLHQGLLAGGLAGGEVQGLVG